MGDDSKKGIRGNGIDQERLPEIPRARHPEPKEESRQARQLKAELDQLHNQIRRLEAELALHDKSKNSYKQIRELIKAKVHGRYHETARQIYQANLKSHYRNIDWIKTEIGLLPPPEQEEVDEKTFPWPKWMTKEPAIWDWFNRRKRKQVVEYVWANYRSTYEKNLELAEKLGCGHLGESKWDDFERGGKLVNYWELAILDYWEISTELGCSERTVRQAVKDLIGKDFYRFISRVEERGPNIIIVGRCKWHWVKDKKQEDKRRLISRLYPLHTEATHLKRWKREMK